MPLTPDEILNQRYRILEIIAQGGMGAVYRAQDLALNIQVALKENFRETDQFARQFRREAALLAALNHPNLPRVTDHFITPQGQYLVMDFIEGEDLREILSRDKTISEAEAIRIGAAVCEAIEYLHSRQPPIVHRDIKPGNIKLSPDGQIYLVDFGLAKQTTGGESTTTGAQALTPGYAPPEQYGQGTDPRSDIYALAATLYAGITGEIPEDGLSRAMGTLELTPVRAHVPSISRPTAAAIETAMSVRPADRYASAMEFRAALLQEKTARPLDTRPVDSRQPNTPMQPAQMQPAVSTGVESLPAEAVTDRGSHPKRVLPGYKYVIGGSVFALLAITIIFGSPIIKQLAIIPRNPAAVPDTPTADTISPTGTSTFLPTPTRTMESIFLVDPTVTATFPPTANSTPTPSSTPPLPTPTPRGGSGKIAYSSDRSGTVQIWLSSPNADGDEDFQITNLPEGACQPDWSPDGKRIVFISPCPGRKDSYPGSSLYIIQADGKSLVPLSSLPGGDFDPAWSPDGDKIAFTSLRSGKPNIYIYDLNTDLTSRISNPVNYERRPAWSPDGQWIAFETTITGQSQIWVMEGSGGSRSEFSPFQSGISRMPAWDPDGEYLLYSQGGDLPRLVSRIFPAKGSPEIRLAETVVGIEDARISPDGWQIAFTLYDYAGNCGVYILSQSGSSMTPLSGTPGISFHPAWQP